MCLPVKYACLNSYVEERMHNKCLVERSAGDLDTDLADENRDRIMAGKVPAMHQTLWLPGETGEDGHICLAGWTLSVVVTEKKKNVIIT